METFKEPKDLEDNPRYREQRKRNLADLEDLDIDAPLIEIINGFNRLPHCFTLQSCYGHFLFKGRNDPHNIDPLPVTDSIADVEYRIAYIAFCMENSESGRVLFEALKEMADLEAENIQFGSPEWFWKRQVNSYALQVGPGRFMHEDKFFLGYTEAMNLEKIRNEFFIRLNKLLR